MGPGRSTCSAPTGSACLAVLGGFALTGRTVQLDVGGLLGQAVPGQQTAGLAADRLSGLFLAMAFGAAVPVSVAFASWAVLPRGDDPPRPPCSRGCRPPYAPGPPGPRRGWARATRWRSARSRSS